MIVSRMARTGLCALLLASSLGTALPSFAVPLLDLRAEDMLPIAAEARTTLHLNANQLTLWNQVEGRTRTVLRERQRRRDALQEQAKTLLGKPDVELRDLAKAADAERTASAAEDGQLQALWLEVNDALDDGQRRQVAGLLGEQLMRVVPEGGAGRPAGGEHTGGRGRGAGGGGHGRGGMGGPGGASLNLGG
jgi:hypothetical protein